MPSRRPHTNSHHGCLQCKAKRVKCDQKQPKCSRCNKRSSECTYRHLMTEYNPFQGGPRRTAPSSSVSFIHHQPYPPPQPQRRPSEPWTPASTVSAPPLTPIVTNVPPAPPSATLSAATPTIKYERTPSTPMIKFEPTPTPPPQTMLAGPTPTFVKQPSTPQPQPQTMVLANPNRQPQARSVSISIPPSLPPPATDSSEPFLFHHYTTNLAVPSMSPILPSDLFGSLNAAVLLHARSVPYVRQVVLCFSALHLASIHPASNYTFLAAALAHKDKALQLFLPAVGEGISPSTAEPLLAASAVLVACEFALPAADPARRTAFDRVDILAHVAGLFQGTNHIFRHNVLPRDNSSSESSCSSRSDSSSPAGAPSPGAHVPWDKAEDSVRRVVNTVESLPPVEDAREETRRSIISHAAMKLRKALSLVSGARRDLHVLCFWLGMVKREFVNLIRTRDPLALVLLGHWAACRANMDVIWWARGWPVAAVVSINEAVDENHKPLLEWCLSHAKGGSPAVKYETGSSTAVASSSGVG